MTEINFNQNIYLYGNCLGEHETEERKKNYFVIYTKPRDCKDIMLSSLEGYFISNINLLEGFCNGIAFKKDQMSYFEQKYQGKFVHFGK